MANSKSHYEQVLSPVYSWTHGGHAAALQRNAEFFQARGFSPQKSGVAVDLGAGSGFQSIPLAQLGYRVKAIDLDRGLLGELRAHSDGLPIETVEANLLDFNEHVQTAVELAVCMTDTILHLDSQDDVRRLIGDVLAALENDGAFVITFRDLTHELADLDRFIPVRSDAETIFTCFLEYEPDTVKVHDLVYRKAGDGWELSKSFYRKLRLSEQWLTDALTEAGYASVESSVENGLLTVVAKKAS